MSEKPQVERDFVIEAMKWAGGRSEGELDYEAKRDHGSSAFWVFAITSPVLFWLVRPRPSGWSIPLYCFSGAFAVPVASIATFFIKMKLAIRLTPRQAIALQIPWLIFDSAFSVFTTWLLFAFLAKF